MKYYPRSHALACHGGSRRGGHEQVDQPEAQAWVFIGEVQKDGQFNVVWKTKGPIRAQPWSQYIAGNDKKKDEPEKAAH